MFFDGVSLAKRTSEKLSFISSTRVYTGHVYMWQVLYTWKQIYILRNASIWKNEFPRATISASLRLLFVSTCFHFCIFLLHVSFFLFISFHLNSSDATGRGGSEYRDRKYIISSWWEVRNEPEPKIKGIMFQTALVLPRRTLFDRYKWHSSIKN